MVEDNKELNKELYKELSGEYDMYTIEEKITQYKPEFDTQINEGVNTCNVRYAPKIKHYSKSISL